MKMKSLDIINSQEGIQKLKELGAEIFLVGGCVRDHFLGKESKDIDIIVRLIDDKTIISTLEKFGRVDKVGKTFGVIKFMPFGWEGEAIDVAQPRIDVLIDKSLGHHGIEAKFDPFITIEADLERRDFRINSIAISSNGKIIDPFNGLKDIENKIICATSQKAFIEDPLRMLRAIQFSARFGFKIEEDTYRMIVENKKDINTISGERIVEELDKIFFKGDIRKGLLLFKDSGLHGQLFKSLMLCPIPERIASREDFYFTVCTTDENFKKVLKGDNPTSKGIKAIMKCWEVISSDFTSDRNVSLVRQKLFDAIQISERILGCKKIPYFFTPVIEEFKSGKFPRNTRELALNGDDLMLMGINGSDIRKAQNHFLSEIFSEKIKNTKEELTNLVK